LALLMAGMDVLDAIAHALSTVSTGGFSTHADSIAHFDSVAIETVLVVAMLGAGSSVAFAWLLWRRNISETRRAFELQVYLVVVAAASLWIWWLRNDNDISASRGFREAFFTVVSVMTTTGHRISDWGSWHPGAATLLLLLVVVGGTAGSVAGGLRWIRVIGMAQFVWRELQRQLHPRSVRTVKVGRSTISEASVDRMHAQMLYVMTVGAVASLVLGLFGEGLTEAITLTLSAISTMGPGFDEAGGIVTAADLTSPERAVLMPVMLTGRVFLYPAFIAVGAGASAISTAMRSTGVRQ
jgi:trk system potassium uptake protein TrkH